MRVCGSLLTVLSMLALSRPAPAAEAPSGAGIVQREVRRFDIGFLTEAIADFPLPGRDRFAPGPLLTWPDEEDEGAGPGGGSFAFGDEEGEGDTYSQWGTRGESEEALDLGVGEAPVSPWTRIDPKALVAIIRRNIAEDSWANRRNAIDADASTLTVCQTPAILDRIDRFLRMLRAQRARMIAVEVAVVPIEALGQEARKGNPYLSAEEFDRIVSRAGPQARTFSLTAYDGQVVSAHAGERRSIVKGYDFVGTGVIPEPRALNEVMPLGLLADVRPRSIGSTGWVHLRLRVFNRAVAGEPQLRSHPHGDFECVTIAQDAIVTELMTRAGNAVLAGFLEGTAEGVRPLAAIARVRPFSLSGEAGAGGGTAEEFSTRMYDIEFVLRRMGTSIDPLSRLPASPEDVETLVKDTIEPASWRDARTSMDVSPTRLLVCNRASVQKKVQDLIEGWIRESSALAMVDAWELTGAAPHVNRFLALRKPGGALPDTWLTQAREVGLTVETHIRLYGLAGNYATLESTLSRTYVADYEAVSGGTNFVIVAFPVPIIRSAGSGLAVSCSVCPLPGGLARLDMRAVQATTTFDKQVQFQSPWKLTAGRRVLQPPPGKSDSDDKAGAGVATAVRADQKQVLVPVDIDLPEQTAWVFDRDSLIPWDVPTVIETRSDGAKPVRVRVARVKLWQGIR